jgi:hypothetical protein
LPNKTFFGSVHNESNVSNKFTQLFLTIQIRMRLKYCQANGHYPINLHLKALRNVTSTFSKSSGADKSFQNWRQGFPATKINLSEETSQPKHLEAINNAEDPESLINQVQPVKAR